MLNAAGPWLRATRAQHGLGRTPARCRPQVLLAQQQTMAQLMDLINGARAELVEEVRACGGVAVWCACGIRGSAHSAVRRPLQPRG